MDAKRILIEGRAIVVRGHDIDTDRIIPARFLRTVTFDGLGEHAFEDDRAEDRAQGRQHPFDNPQFANATVLVVGANFGCGSSREHAPQALARWGQGIQAIIGESFAEIFFGNCVALGLPCVKAPPTAITSLMGAIEADPRIKLAVDIEAREVRWNDTRLPVELDDGPRQQFLEGRWDSTAELLQAKDAVLAEAAQLPYFQGYRT